MTDTDDTFTARLPSGERVRLRVKRDVEKLNDLDLAPGERLKATLKMFPGPKRSRDEQNFRSTATGALYPRAGRSFLDMLNAPIDDDDENEDAEEESVEEDDLDDDDLNKKDPPMETSEIMKRHPLAFCKVVAEDGDAHGVSEHELTDALTAHAKAAYPDLSPAQAFAKIFTAATDEGRTLRQAVAIAKAAPFNVVPVVVSGERARGRDVDTDNPEAAMAAYRELQAKAAEYRRANPALSEAQAFSAVFTSRENAALAARAHRRPSAV
jgi:hypothetical protein